MSSIKDIARCNVNISTVLGSNDKSKVSKETYEKIMKVVKELVMYQMFWQKV